MIGEFLAIESLSGLRAIYFFCRWKGKLGSHEGIFPANFVEVVK